MGQLLCTDRAMLVLYLFGSCQIIYGILVLVHKEGVFCISCTVANFYAIKWVALSIILTECKVYCSDVFGKCSAIGTMASNHLVGNSVMLSLGATSSLNQWVLLHVAYRGRAGMCG